MKKICVIFGGASTEHDISVITAMQLCKNLESKYSIEKIYMDLDNHFYLATKIKNARCLKDSRNAKLKPVDISNGAIYVKGLTHRKICDVQVMINCCHGGVGENGDLAGFFEINNIPYTSAPSLSAHIAMDKTLSKTLVSDIVATNRGVKLCKEDMPSSIEKVKELKDELIVKPNSLGSSIGVKACTKENFLEQVESIFEMNDSALVEERVVNLIEYNQACFASNDGLVTSLIEQPISKSDFLTFDEKYRHNNKSKSKDRIIPARINNRLEEEITENTKKIYNRLNLNGVVRIDYIYDTDTDTLYFNEVNTVPGSLSFYLYEPMGIDYITLVEQLISHPTIPHQYTYFNTDILDKTKF